MSRNLYKHDPELKRQIRDGFGPDVFDPDGSINRDRLGAIVFHQPDEMKKLVSWIHPKVRTKIADFFQTQAQQKEKFAIAVIPILYESGLESQYDEVWVVSATREQQLERLMKRSETEQRPLTLEQAEARLNSQLPLAEKIKKAHVVIDNTGTLDETYVQLDQKILDLRG